MVTKYKDSGNARTAVTDDADHSYEQGLGAGERNVDSATDGYQVTRKECNVTVCDGTSSVAIGAGSASDTHLLGVTILAAATPVTATIAGFTKKNNAGTEAAASIVLTGEDADEAPRLAGAATELATAFLTPATGPSGRHRLQRAGNVRWCQHRRDRY